MTSKFFSIILLSAFLSLPNGSYCQATAVGNTFADASTLYNALFKSNGVNPPSPETAKNILNYYFGTTINNYNDFVTKATSSNNSFLLDRNVIGKIQSIYNARQPVIAAPPEGYTGTGSVVTNLSATNILLGVTQFLISRGEQELSMAFFSRFQKAMTQFPEIAYLFPKTSAMLNNITNSNLLTLLQQLKDAFMKDLVNMPGNILSLRNITYVDSICHCKARVDAIKAALSTGESSVILVASLTIIQNLINGTDIAAALNKAVTDNTVCSSTSNIAGYLKLSSFLIQSLKANDASDGVLINASDLHLLFFNKDLFNLFLGLAYQQAFSSNCYGNFTIAIGAGNHYKLLDVLQKIYVASSTVYDGLDDLQKINANFLAIRASSQKGTPLDPANYSSLISAVLHMVSSVCQTTATLLGDDPAANSTLQLVATDLNTGADICTDIQQKNYSGIFNDVTKFIKDNQLFKDGSTQQNLITYLSFASNLASATNPDQVQNALQAVALPPGSYSVKQKSSFNLSLNGYIGYAWDIGQGHGIYAPMGLAASFGTDKSVGGAITIFLSAVDLGGIASYNVQNNNSVSTLKQNITFQSVIAPGVQAFYEIPKWPLAFGCGWRMTPKLFYNGTSGLVPVNSESVFTLAVLIDIPLFTLYNRPFK